MRAGSVEYKRGLQLKLMRLPEFRVSEPCLRALEVESDRTGKSVYEIARRVIEQWVDTHQESLQDLVVND